MCWTFFFCISSLQLQHTQRPYFATTQFKICQFLLSFWDDFFWAFFEADMVPSTWDTDSRHWTLKNAKMLYVQLLPSNDCEHLSAYLRVVVDWLVLEIQNGNRHFLHACHFKLPRWFLILLGKPVWWLLFSPIATPILRYPFLHQGHDSCYSKNWNGKADYLHCTVTMIEVFQNLYYVLLLLVYCALCC